MQEKWVVSFWAKPNSGHSPCTWKFAGAFDAQVWGENTEEEVVEMLEHLLLPIQRVPIQPFFLLVVLHREIMWIRWGIRCALKDFIFSLPLKAFKSKQQLENVIMTATNFLHCYIHLLAVLQGLEKVLQVKGRYHKDSQTPENQSTWNWKNMKEATWEHIVGLQSSRKSLWFSWPPWSANQIQLNLQTFHF